MSTKIYRGNTEIGDVLLCRKYYTSQKITNFSLDGIAYVQNTGTAQERRKVSVWCPTKAKRDLLDAASNDGALLIIRNWKGFDIKGYIEKDVSWQEFRAEHGEGDFTLMVKEVVASA